MNHRLPALIGPLGVLGCLLAACSADTQVSLTGNTPAQYSHVWVTTQELWFNSASTAGPADGGWVKFPLSTPTTIDLVGANNGNLSNIVDDLHIVPGTYSQVRVIPIDASTPLTTSAQTAGALYNSEADFVDSAGLTHQLPLELLNPDQGFGIATSLKVPVGNVGAALAGTGSTTGATTGAFGGNTATVDPSTGLPIGNNTTTGTTAGTTTGTGSTTSTQPPNEFAVFLDGTTDLVPFSTSTYTGGTGIMLSPHASAYDLSQSAGISGQLTLTNITTSTSGLPAIQVSAQVLSADGTRHVVVSSAPVQADGSFMLYPLAANSSNVTYYDVVIHGPGIATIIIKSVQVELPSSSSTTSPFGTSTTGTTTAPRRPAPRRPAPRRPAPPPPGRPRPAPRARPAARARPAPRPAASTPWHWVLSRRVRQPPTPRTSPRRRLPRCRPDLWSASTRRCRARARCRTSSRQVPSIRSTRCSSIPRRSRPARSTRGPGRRAAQRSPW